MSSITQIIAGLQPAFAYESLTISNTAKALTETTYLNGNRHAKRVVITVEDAQIRYRYDGTAPTATEGHLANPMDVIILKSASNIKNFQAIRKGTTNAKIRITYEY